MIGSDSSGANDGSETERLPQVAAAPSRSAASTLLLAADIWSAGSGSPAATDLPPAVERVKIPEKAQKRQKTDTRRGLRASEVLAEARFFTANGGQSQDAAPAPSRANVAPIASPSPTRKPDLVPLPPAPNPARVHTPGWPPRKLSLALQGGGSFGAFTWGVLERLLEQPECEIDALSGASVGAINAALLACGLVENGREGARNKLSQFWNRITTETSFRSLMLIGGFSPAGTSVAFGPALRSGQFDPFDLDPLRAALSKDIDFATLRAAECPKLLIAATRVRDGRLKTFVNAEITTDVLLASTCPPQVHCAVDGEAYWDGSFASNPPIIELVRQSQGADVLVIQATPSHDSYIPITMAAIDRRLDQIMANSALNAEIAGLQFALGGAAMRPRIFRIAAEDEIDGLAQRSAVDLGRGFIALLHERGRSAADRWLRQRSPVREQPCPREPLPEEPVAALARELHNLLEEAAHG